MAKDDQLDLALPAEILELGEALHSKASFRRPSPRQPGAPVPPEQADAPVDALLEKASRDPAARRLLGLRRGVGREAARARLKAVAVLGWQSLRLSSDPADIGDLATAAADPRLQPIEGLLRARHEVGLMLAEDALLGSSESADGPVRKARLPWRTLEWLSGGRDSMGCPTLAKLVGLPPPRDAGPDARPPEPRLPTARQLYEGIRGRVIGLDRQAEVISARLVMHMTRARMLKAGEDPGTPNECWIIIGPPGAGKTHLCEVAGELGGTVFASVDGSDLSAEGYVGLSVSDTLRHLVMAAKGDVERARYGFLAIDEFTKKARSMGGDSPVNTVGVQQEALRMISGQAMQIGGRRGWDKPIPFNTVGTAFALLGHCPGLGRLMEKRRGRRRLGFSVADGDRRSRAWLLDALMDFGLIEELVSRLTAIVVVPPPSLETLARAASAERGIVDAYNRLLAGHGAMLFLSPPAIGALAEYGMESRGYFRAMKRVVSALAGEVVFEERKGTTLVEAADVRRAAAKADGAPAGLQEGLGRAAAAGEPAGGDHDESPEKAGCAG